jgi:predicted 3-demethylubiquinone-9 3-methyltransferase (glyoxalase superfamily)
MSKRTTQKLVTHLWYAKEAEEAARFYATVFPDSRVDRVTALQAESPSGPAGSVKVVEFTVLGQQLMAITAGPHAEFNDAISLLVKCDTQAEIDKYWNAILEGGGKPSACGWINDRFGVRWQITFSGMGEMLANPDQAKAGRAAEAMLKQVKIDIAALQAAYNGG